MAGILAVSALTRFPPLSLRTLHFSLRVVLTGLLVTLAVAQETTAGIAGGVKDPSGAMVPNAVIEIRGPALQGVKTLITDVSGKFQFMNLPVGEYTLTVSATGFRTHKQVGINLATGRLPSFTIVLQLGAATEIVEAAGTTAVDVTQARVQVNLTNEFLRNVPKGESSGDAIEFAPGVRTEPLQGGFQIGGASNNENSYLIEGQETSSIQNGVWWAGLPVEFVQEVQVKPSGFEAQYGGALGGVVNVIQKRGANQWHGSLVLNLRTDRFDAAPNRTLRYVPNTSPTVIMNSGVPVAVLDAPSEYFQGKKDCYSILQSGFELGGYALKDRLWVYAGFLPQLKRKTRVVEFAATSPTPGLNTFHFDDTIYYSQARIDLLATRKIRHFAAWNYAYHRTMGDGLPFPDSPWGQYNPMAVFSATNWPYQNAILQPNVIFNTGADITLTPNLIATSRFGQFFTDAQTRGTAVGPRYRYSNTNYPYSGVSGTKTVGGVVVPKTSLTGESLPATFAQPASYSTIASNIAYIYNKYKRTSFSQDFAYFFKRWGTHSLKTGYQVNRLWNDEIYGANTSLSYVAYGTPYRPWSLANYSNCAAISAQNVSNYGTSGVNAKDAASGASCTGLWGTINFYEYGDIGEASSFNHALYFQDAWTVGRGVTLNLGMRFDKEDVPSYIKSFPGISFGFLDKAAPRVAASWDLLGNGKLKLFGSYGSSFDIMKYELSKYSFGGSYMHSCVYALDVYDYNTIIPVRGANKHFCNPTGGANFAGGGTPAGLRFIENHEFNIYSNDPNAPGSLGPTGHIDPALKPMKQHEYVVGADWAFSSMWMLESRYTRKRLDRTIEDSGMILGPGEQYYVVNPGFGINAHPVATTDCSDCPAQPKASRRYDGLEFRVTHRSTGKWFASLSYTYSRLQGNYSGLTATDVSDDAPRSSPNFLRYFDEPYMQYDAHGRVIDGPLATDRPHTFKATAFYRLKWWKFDTLLGGFQQWYSGTPLSSYMHVDNGEVFVEGRGNMVQVAQDPTTGVWTATGVKSIRTKPFSQTDLSLIHEIHLSKTNERLVAAVEANVANVFNQHSPTIYSQSIDSTTYLVGISPDIAVNVPATSTTGVDWHTLMHGYDYIAAANSGLTPLTSFYGKPTNFQAGRFVTFRLRFSF